MNRKLVQLLPISDAELPRFLSMSSLFFLLMLGWGVGNSGRESIFISTAGVDKLPVIYILNALLVIIAASVYFKLTARLSHYRFFITLLAVFAGLLIVLTAIIPRGFSWTPYAVYVFPGIFLEVLIMLHFWTLANDIFDPREGKRILPLIGGAGLAGVMIGGALTKPLVSLVGTANLLFLWSLVLVGLIPMVLWVRRTAADAGVAENDTHEKGDDPGSKPFGQISVIWNIALIRSMAYMSIPMWITVYFVDFQFFITMAEVTTSQDQLTGLLGIINSLIALTGLMLQLFVTPRLLESIGVGATMMVHPSLMAVSAILLSFRSVLTPNPSSSIFSFRSFTAISASFSDETMAHSTGHSASELLFNGIPQKLRAQSRAFITGLIGPFCIVIAGVTLLILSTLGVPETVYAGILAVSCTLWFFSTLKLKNDYLHGLVECLKSQRPDIRDSAASELSHLRDNSTIQILIDLLASRDDEVALFALELLGKIGYPGLAQHLCEVLPKTSSCLKIEILSMLRDCKDHDILDSVTPLLSSPEPVVVSASIRAIAKLGSESDLTQLERFLDSEELEVRSEAVVAFIQAQPTLDSHSRAISILKDMSNASDAALREKAAYIIGEVQAKKLIQLLSNLAESAEESVQLAVIKASAKTDDEDVVPPLAKFFESDRLLHHVIEAIIQLDKVAVSPLQHLLMVPMLNEKVKRQMLYCLGRIGRIESIPTLLRLLEIPGAPTAVSIAVAQALVMIKTAANKQTDGTTDSKPATVISRKDRIKITEYLRNEIEKIKIEKSYVHTLEALRKKDDVRLLIDAVTRVCDQRMALILLYLELTRDQKVIRTVSFNLKGKDPRARAEALEILDGAGSEARELVRILEKDNVPIEERNTLNGEVEILTALLDSDQSSWVNACTVYAIGNLGLRVFEPTLIELTKRRRFTDTVTDSSLFYALSNSDRQLERQYMVRNNIFLALHKFEVDISKMCELKEIDKMAINMGRMLFLRRVPLFVDLEGSDLQFLSEICIEKEYSAGESIFEEADDGDALYIIESGRVRIVTGSENPVTLGVLEERECFGEMSILDGELRSASAIAGKDSKLLVILRKDFHGILLARPQIAISLFRTLSLRFRETLNQLTIAQRKEVFKHTA